MSVFKELHDSRYLSLEKKVDIYNNIKEVLITKDLGGLNCNTTEYLLITTLGILYNKSIKDEFTVSSFMDLLKTTKTCEENEDLNSLILQLVHNQQRSNAAAA